MIRAAIFDLDGLLVDSERLAVQSWLDAAQETGLVLTRACVLSTIGLDWGRTMEMIRREIPCENDFNLLRERVLHIRSRRFPEGIPSKAGAHEILKYLARRGIPVGVATGTGRLHAEKLLSALGFDCYIAASAFGDEVLHGKPNPGIHLLVAARLSVEPVECVALEDSPAGLLAARTAGMTTIHVPDLIEPDRESAENSDYITADLFEAAVLLQGWFDPLSSMKRTRIRSQ